ncbi:MAG: hypothetical protein KDA62_21095, partial [Planctomycetales bacterium]|nr:hypothetical protein [Planctomycetales bacterium]
TQSRSDFVVHTAETSGISKSAATTTSAEKRRARRLPFDAKRQSEDDLLSAIDAFFAEIDDFGQ